MVNAPFFFTLKKHHRSTAMQNCIPYIFAQQTAAPETPQKPGYGISNLADRSGSHLKIYLDNFSILCFLCQLLFSKYFRQRNPDLNCAACCIA